MRVDGGLPERSSSTRPVHKAPRFWRQVTYSKGGNDHVEASDRPDDLGDSSPGGAGDRVWHLRIHTDLPGDRHGRRRGLVSNGVGWVSVQVQGYVNPESARALG